MISSVLSLESYQKAMKHLDKDLRQFEHDIDQMKYKIGNETLENYQATPKVEHNHVKNPSYSLHVIDKIKCKLDFVKMTHEENNDLFLDIVDELTADTNQKLGTEKRSVFGSLIHLTSPLTGIASRKSVLRIKDEVKKVNVDNERTRHLVDNMLTILNATNFDLLNTKLKVNDITDSISELDDNLKSVYKLAIDLANGQDEVRILFELESRLNRIEFLTNYLGRKMQKLVRVLADLSAGKMTIDLLKPKELKSILNYVAANIPSNLDISGHGQKGHLLDLYKSLHTESFIHDGKIVTIFSIPLSSTRQKFMLYNVINPFVPDLETGMSARYAVEGQGYLAISSDFFVYAIPSSEEISVCLSAGGNYLSGYCRLQRPCFVTHGYPTCLISLYLQNKEHIEKYCKIEVRETNSMGFHYISNGRWMITTNEPLVIKKSCNDAKRVTNVKIEPPMSLITLENGCNAFTGSVLLPSHFSGGSTYNFDLIQDISDKLTDISNREFQIFQYLLSGEGKPDFKEWVTNEISKLPVGSSIFLDVNQAKRDLKNYKTNKKRKFLWICIGSVIGGIVLLIVLVACLKYRLSKALLKSTGKKSKSGCLHLLKFLKGKCCGKDSKLTNRKKALSDFLSKLESQIDSGDFHEIIHGFNGKDRVKQEHAETLGSKSANA